MSDEVTERLTKVETALDGHLRECGETNRRTEKALDSMRDDFTEFMRDFKQSQGRFHERLDDQAAKVASGFAQAEGARKDLRIAALGAVVMAADVIDVDDVGGDFLQILTYLQNTDGTNNQPLMTAQQVTDLMAAWP